MVYREIFEDIYSIEIGRNESENDQLVKGAKQSSLWFHLSGMPSPHGILTNTLDEGTYSNGAIIRCAELVKGFSKSKNLHRVKVDYLPITHVQRTAKAGLVVLKKSPRIVIV